MEKIRQKNVGAYNWLHKINPNHWLLYAFDHNAKCDCVTNNMTESSNAWIGEGRKQLIVNMVEYIRKKMMLILHNKRKKWESKKILCLLSFTRN